MVVVRGVMRPVRARRTWETHVRGESSSSTAQPPPSTLRGSSTSGFSVRPARAVSRAFWPRRSLARSDVDTLRKQQPGAFLATFQLPKEQFSAEQQGQLEKLKEAIWEEASKAQES